MKLKYVDFHSLSYIKVSDKYQNVCIFKVLYNQTLIYQGRLGKSGIYEKWGSKYFTTEVEAAKEVDLQLIKRGKSPVNVLRSIR